MDNIFIGKGLLIPLQRPFFRHDLGRNRKELHAWFEGADHHPQQRKADKGKEENDQYKSNYSRKPLLLRNAVMFHTASLLSVVNDASSDIEDNADKHQNTKNHGNGGCITDLAGSEGSLINQDREMRG